MAFNDPTNAAEHLAAGLLATNRVNLGTTVAEAYAAVIALDATQVRHRIAGVSTTSAAPTINAAYAGVDGDVLLVEVTSDASGTCTVTFGTHFKPSATLAVTASHYASVLFVSDGVNWKEQYRSAIVAS